MAFVPGNNVGSLNGTSVVNVVPAPAAATQRMIRSGYIYNGDTAPVTVKLGVSVSGTPTYTTVVTLQVGDTLQCDEDDYICLDATSKTLAVSMAGAAATTNPTFCFNWADNS